jgi:TRAP-type C4-dicarboxylate transport system permease small subunit
MNPSSPTAGQRLARYCDVALGALAGALLFAMMVLTFVDVVLRYFFNSPLTGGFEISEIMMAVLIFAGLPLVSRRHEHVTIDAFDGLFPASWRRGFHVVVQLICAVTLVGMAWLLARKAGTFVEAGDVTQTLKIAIAPFVYLMAALTLATAVVHLAYVFAQPPAPVSAAETATDGTVV